MSDYTTTFTVEQSPEEVFKAINDVRSWWTGDVEGSTDGLGDEFTYQYGELHWSRQRVIEFVPGRKVLWRVVDARLTFTDDPSEWAGTAIGFTIQPDGDQTRVTFAHVGLTSALECFDQCSSAWSFFVNGSLRRLITTGEGPTPPPWS
jgi:hypothetical protein